MCASFLSDSSRGPDCMNRCGLRGAALLIVGMLFMLSAPLVNSMVFASGVHDAVSHAGHRILPAANDYSLFMHHSSGLALVVLSALVFSDRLSRRRLGILQVGIGVLWIVFGTHLFIRSDPEGWPIGPAGFLQSFSTPTSSEWIQHKLLSMIPLALGAWTFVQYRLPKPPHDFITYAIGAMLAVGGAGLLFHQHMDHPGMDIVNIQHRFMAMTSLFIAAGTMLEGLASSTWRLRPFFVPSGLMILGLQLLIYIE
jgi:copper resistance protein D